MIGMIPAKIVAVLAVGGSIFYGMAHLRDRDVPDGVRSRLEGALVPAVLRRSSSLVVLQRRAAENDTCASPTMIADCTLAPRAAGNGPNGAKSSSDEAKDPSYTGTTKINEKSARRDNNQRSRRLGASSLPHPRPVAAKSRAYQAYAGRRARPVRWVARRQRWPGFAERYAPTVAYTPW
jgi:hypothetical protein